MRALALLLLAGCAAATKEPGSAPPPPPPPPTAPAAAEPPPAPTAPTASSGAPAAERPAVDAEGSCAHAGNALCTEYANASPAAIKMHAESCTKKRGVWRVGPCSHAHGACRSVSITGTVDVWYTAPLPAETIKKVCSSSGRFFVAP